MTKRKPSGNDILRKLASLDNDLPRDHPQYMTEYKKRIRKVDKRNDPIIKQLEDQAEKLWRDLEKQFNFHRTGPRR